MITFIKLRLDGTLFKSCETELMELMRQIDLMMQSRKAEWEGQRQALQAKLEVREQEANVQGAMLEKKTQEVCLHFSSVKYLI